MCRVRDGAGLTRFRHIDLFSGIGGFSLAAQWVWGDKHEIVCFCEMDPFCQKVLWKHWPGVPIVEDVRDVESIKRYAGTNVTLLTGGYPCQAFSTASHGQIVAEDFSPFMLDVIKEIQPKYIIAENVQEQTIYDFKEQIKSFGYGAFMRRLSVYDFGADHYRNRWFCIAYPNNKSKLPGKINARLAFVQSIQNDTWGWKNYARTIRISDGIPNRVDRLKALGNAIVPQVVVPIMQAIKEIECGTWTP